MSVERPKQYFIDLVFQLCDQPAETEWLEFKVNNANPELIGEYISALSNSAALSGRSTAYMVWGVEDVTHELVGTTFKPSFSKKGNEELENWLLRSLDPQVDIRFIELRIEETEIVLLEIAAAFAQPVRFQVNEFIRVGTLKKKLREHPEKERELWRVFDKVPFEKRLAAEHLSAADVLMLLDYPRYFDLLDLPLPEGREGILKALTEDELIEPCDAGGWNIFNLGAILFSKKLNDFPSLKRKAVRVVQYKGTGKTEAQREQLGNRGYASGWEGLIDYIIALLPSNEIIGRAFRQDIPMYPERAIRELAANALIHQDFSITGAGPIIEIFEDRLEITNPGSSLVPIDRFLNAPPKSRNEALASLMRRFNICEERGTGIDKVVLETEMYQLPPPLFELLEQSTRSSLFSYQPWAKMDETARIRACYWHACLKRVQRDFLTNSSLRQRFGLAQSYSSSISRLISASVAAGAIVPYDREAAPKLMKYVPRWAVEEE